VVSQAELTGFFAAGFFGAGFFATLALTTCKGNEILATELRGWTDRFLGCRSLGLGRRLLLYRCLQDE